MTTINDIRKAIKPIGFTVRTERFSFGKSATYVHLETGHKLTFNIVTSDIYAQWLPLIQFCKNNEETLRAIQKSEHVTGLVMHGFGILAPAN